MDQLDQIKDEIIAMLTSCDSPDDAIELMDRLIELLLFVRELSNVTWGNDNE